MLIKSIKLHRIIILSFLILGLFVPNASAARTLTGGSILIQEGESVEGFTAFAGTLTINGRVNGDITVFAGDVNINGEVKGNLEAFAGNIRIDGIIDGNVEAFGGSVSLGDQGDIKGSFEANSGTVDVAGTVDGDAKINTGSLTLSPNAKIMGNLEYNSEIFNKNTNAVVSGSIKPRFGTDTPKFGRTLGRVLGIYLFLANLIFGALLLLISPNFAINVSDRVKSEPLKMVSAGIITLFATPILLLLLLITIIGIPLSFIGGILFIVFLWTANIYGKFSIGSWLLFKMNRKNNWMALFIGLSFGFILGFIPIIGVFIKLLILLLGIGGLIFSLKMRLTGG